MQRRDTELDEINDLCSNILEELTQEKHNTEIEIEKNLEKQQENKDQEMVDEQGNKVDIMQDLIRLEGELKSYLDDVEGLIAETKMLENHYVACFDAFNQECPKSVKDLRKLREQNKKEKTVIQALKRPPSFLKPSEKSKLAKERDEEDIYKLIQINCNHRQRIRNLLKQAKEQTQKRKDIEEQYAEMRKEVFKIKQIKLYKPVRGDVVDEMFAGYLNKAKLAIDVQRISASNYMFGTKKILAKIINGNLVIRVGGGYMNAEEFIEQYGKIEMMKIMKMEEHHEAVPKNDVAQTRNSMRPGTSLGLESEIKEKMRQTLMNTFQTKQFSQDDQNLA